MKAGCSNVFAKKLERPFFVKDTPIYGKSYHKSYANV